MADTQVGSSSTEISRFTDESHDVTPSSPQRDDGSGLSDLSDSYLQTDPSRANGPPKVFQQNTNRHDFKRMTMAGADMTEAFGGAQEIVSNLNPEYYSLAAGSRVVNLKTDEILNLFKSVKTSKWSTLEKVSQRITTVWNAREKASDKILFLVAINGHKHFCGLAEMSGPWEPTVYIDGWVDNGKGAKCVGSIPVTWRFVKDVPYGNFHDVHQKRNGQPVVNMWNGMHIEPDTVDEVVQAYVTAPHYTNLLASPKKHHQLPAPHAIGNDRGQHRIDAPGPGFSSRRQSASTRGNHRGNPSMRGPYPGSRNTPAFKSDNWRQPQELFLPSPRAAHGPFRPNNVHPPGFDGSHERGAAPRPGQVVSFVFDENSNMVPITPHTATSMVFPIPEQNQDMHDAVYVTGESDHGMHRGTHGGRAASRTGAWRARGNHLHGATSYQNMRETPPPSASAESNERSDHAFRGGHPGGGHVRPAPTEPSTNRDYPHHLRHRASVATFQSTASWSPIEEHPISSAPAAKGSMSHTPSAASKAQQAPRSFDLRAAAAAAEFKPQSERAEANDYPNPLGTKRSKTSPQGLIDQNKGALWGVVGMDDQGQLRYQPMERAGSDHTSNGGAPGSSVVMSDASYPDFFKGADSMAGFDPTPTRPKFTLQPQLPDPDRLQHQLQQVMDTLTPAPHSSAESSGHQDSDGYGSKLPVPETPTLTSGPGKPHGSKVMSNREIAEGAVGLPSESAELYYKLVGEKIALAEQLQNADSIDNSQFCEIMSRLSHLETMLRGLRTGLVNVNESLDEHRDDFGAPSVTSSAFRFNMSPERRADGSPMESASRRVSPDRKGRLPSRSPRDAYKDTPAGKMKQTMFPDDYLTDTDVTHTLEMKEASSPTTWSVTAGVEHSPRSPDNLKSRPSPTTAAHQEHAGHQGTRGMHGSGYRNDQGSGGAPVED